jgi:hypothetical protein
MVDEREGEETLEAKAESLPVFASRRDASYRTHVNTGSSCFWFQTAILVSQRSLLLHPWQSVNPPLPQTPSRERCQKTLIQTHPIPRKFNSNQRTLPRRQRTRRNEGGERSRRKPSPHLSYLLKVPLATPCVTCRCRSVSTTINLYLK